jgi:UDP-glucose 4-epimerase
MVEQVMSDLVLAQPDFSAIVLRYFNPVGAHESGLIGEDPNGIPNNLMPFINQVAIGRRPHLAVFGDDYDTPDGTGVRDYIHVCDLASGHVKALETLHQNPGFHVFNLGTGQGVSVLQMVEAYRRISGQLIAYQVAPRRPGDIACCYADSSRAEQQLNWKAERGLDQMVADSWNWQKLNPNGYSRCS